MTDIATLTAKEIGESFANRSLSPIEVTGALLDRIELLNPALNAFYLVGEEEARQQARDSEDRWMKGAPLSALDGVPTSIKDALPSKGSPSYRGSAAHSAEQESVHVDAPSVARMREAGMVFLGKTTMPDFGIFASGLSSKHGVTRNPWDLTKTPGGSSAGTAASIAAGLNPVAVGTDIVGSIRLPASFCGIFGFKPSQGRVPYYFPNSPSLIAGPMARTVSDAALLMNVIAKPDARDFTALPYDAVRYDEVLQSDLLSAKIGYISDLGFGSQPDIEVVKAVGDGARRLKEAGFSVHQISHTFSGDDMRAAERFYKSRARAEYMQFAKDRRDAAAVISDWSREAEDMTAVDLYKDFNHLQRMRGRTVAMIADFDFLVLPTVHIPAFDANQAGLSGGRLFEPWINNFLFNLSEQPASSVPCGLTQNGLPIGLQIVGRRYHDEDVFKLSKVAEGLFDWRKILDDMTKKLRSE